MSTGARPLNVIVLTLALGAITPPHSTWAESCVLAAEHAGVTFPVQKIAESRRACSAAASSTGSAPEKFCADAGRTIVAATTFMDTTYKSGKFGMYTKSQISACFSDYKTFCIE